MSPSDSNAAVALTKSLDITEFLKFTTKKIEGEIQSRDFSSDRFVYTETKEVFISKFDSTKDRVASVFMDYEHLWKEAASLAAREADLGDDGEANWGAPITASSSTSSSNQSSSLKVGATPASQTSLKTGISSFLTQEDSDLPTSPATVPRKTPAHVTVKKEYDIGEDTRPSMLKVISFLRGLDPPLKVRNVREKITLDPLFYSAFNKMEIKEQKLNVLGRVAIEYRRKLALEIQTQRRLVAEYERYAFSPSRVFKRSDVVNVANFDEQLATLNTHNSTRYPVNDFILGCFASHVGVCVKLIVIESAKSEPRIHHYNPSKRYPHEGESQTFYLILDKQHDFFYRVEECKEEEGQESQSEQIKLTENFEFYTASDVRIIHKRNPKRVSDVDGSVDGSESDGSDSDAEGERRVDNLSKYLDIDLEEEKYEDLEDRVKSQLLIFKNAVNREQAEDKLLKYFDLREVPVDESDEIKKMLYFEVSEGSSSSAATSDDKQAGRDFLATISEVIHVSLTLKAKVQMATARLFFSNIDSARKIYTDWFAYFFMLKATICRMYWKEMNYADNYHKKNRLESNEYKAAIDRKRLDMGENYTEEIAEADEREGMRLSNLRSKEAAKVLEDKVKHAVDVNKIIVDIYENVCSIWKICEVLLASSGDFASFSVVAKKSAVAAKLLSDGAAASMPAAFSDLVTTVAVQPDTNEGVVQVVEFMEKFTTVKDYRRMNIPQNNKEAQRILSQLKEKPPAPEKPQNGPNYAQQMHNGSAGKRKRSKPVSNKSLFGNSEEESEGEESELETPAIKRVAGGSDNEPSAAAVPVAVAAAVLAAAPAAPADPAAAAPAVIKTAFDIAWAKEVEAGKAVEMAEDAASAERLRVKVAAEAKEKLERRQIELQEQEIQREQQLRHEHELARSARMTDNINLVFMLKYRAITPPNKLYFSWGIVPFLHLVVERQHPQGDLLRNLCTTGLEDNSYSSTSKCTMLFNECLGVARAYFIQHKIDYKDKNFVFDKPMEYKHLCYSFIKLFLLPLIVGWIGSHHISGTIPLGLEGVPSIKVVIRQRLSFMDGADSQFSVETAVAPHVDALMHYVIA